MPESQLLLIAHLKQQIDSLFVDLWKEKETNARLNDGILKFSRAVSLANVQNSIQREQIEELKKPVLIREAASQTFYGNLTTEELLRYVDRSTPDTNELAGRLEMALSLIDMAGRNHGS